MGGSSQCWGGLIKPFEKNLYTNSFKSMNDQSWGELSLKDYDLKSLNLLNSPIFDFDPEILAKKLNSDLPDLPDKFYYSTYAMADEPLRLKNLLIENIAINPDEINQKNNILCNYKLIDYNLNSKNINQLIFENKHNKLFVKSDFFIIAMGGIENAGFAKKIPNYESNNPQNIGNFQEHPHFYSIGSFKKGEKEIPDLLQEFRRVFKDGDYFKNNGYIKLKIGYWEGKGFPKVNFEIVKKEVFRNPINIAKEIGRSILRDYTMDYDYLINIRCEQSPNMKSFYPLKIKIPN